MAREMPWSRASASGLVRSRNPSAAPARPARSRSAPGCLWVSRAAGVRPAATPPRTRPVPWGRQARHDRRSRGVLRRKMIFGETSSTGASRPFPGLPVRPRVCPDALAGRISPPARTYFAEITSMYTAPLYPTQRVTIVSQNEDRNLPPIHNARPRARATGSLLKVPELCRRLRNLASGWSDGRAVNGLGRSAAILIQPPFPLAQSGRSPPPAPDRVWQDRRKDRRLCYRAAVRPRPPPGRR